MSGDQANVDGRVRYDRTESAYVAEPDGRPPSRRVVAAVAAATGRDTVATQPLYEAVDPDALDALFASPFGGADRGANGTVSFRLDGCTVAVHAGGRVVVEPPVDG